MRAHGPYDRTARHLRRWLGDACRTTAYVERPSSEVPQGFALDATNAGRHAMVIPRDTASAYLQATAVNRQGRLTCSEQWTWAPRLPQLSRSSPSWDSPSSRSVGSQHRIGRLGPTSGCPRQLGQQQPMINGDTRPRPRVTPPGRRADMSQGIGTTETPSEAGLWCGRRMSSAVKRKSTDAAGQRGVSAPYARPASLRAGGLSCPAVSWRRGRRCRVRRRTRPADGRGCPPAACPEKRG